MKLLPLAEVVRTKNIYDGMRVLPVEAARQAGFIYQGVGVVADTSKTPPFDVSENSTQ